MSQIKGVVAYGVFIFVFAFVLFLILKIILGLRVSPEEESEGLDIGEHGNVAYPDFTSKH
jgi:Amt family ammonium transporter